MKATLERGSEMIDLPTPETDAVAEKNIYGVACKVDVDFARKLERERDEARESLENAREVNKWLTVFLEHIRDNADIRYGKHRGLLAFSDLKEEASRKRKEAAK